MRRGRDRARFSATAALLGAAAAILAAGCGHPVESGPAADPATVVHRVAEAPRRPPNIVVILADDLGYGDLGSYGSAIRTPNLDRMAADGVRFTDFHASDSVCTPSRAGLLTGRYAKRMGLDVPLMSGKATFGQAAATRFGFLMGSLGLMDLATEGGADGLHADEVTMAEALRVAGYRTGMIGKWHLGDFTTAPRHNPVEHGFDHHFGVPHSNDMHPFPLYRDREQVMANVDDQAALTGLYTEEAVRFIEASKDKPFFLYFAHTFPHRPLFASDAFRGRSAGGIFGDAVEEVDWSVGKVLDALKKAGVDDDTLVMFTSDNGPWYDGSPGALRGRKGQSFEGGFRVPFVARWPGHVAPGSVCAEPAMNTDLFPTALALAGLSLPGDRAIDGADITALLTTPGAASPDRRLYFYHQGELEGVRDGKWKYFRSLNHYVWPMPVNRKNGRMSEHTTGPLPLLFDLQADPGEAYNVADRHADVAGKLAGDLEAWDSAMAGNRKGWKH